MSSRVAPARAVAHKTLLRVTQNDAFADRALRAEAAGLKDPRDRALAKQLVFGAIQQRARLDWQIAQLGAKRLDPPVRAALQLGLYEITELRTPDHAAVAEAVELAKPSPGQKVVNAVLRRALREGAPEPPADDTPKGAAIRHSHPRWIVELWWDWIGADATRAMLAANNRPAEFALRVNTLVEHDPAELPPGRRDGDALVVDGPFDLESSPLFARGVLLVQSRAAQSVARILDPQPGERILDLCAAPGGKTTHAAALMGNSGTIVAVEKHTGRAGALQLAAQRLHATNIEVQIADARRFKTGEPFDRVLLDPPCSGLGTLRTHPDLRWRMTPEKLAGIIPLQKALVSAATAALRPGGLLVYSVCTLNPAEEHVADPGAHRTWPHEDDTDGFYIAQQWKPRAP